MERYTVRILYRDTEIPGKFVGVVEADGVAGKRGFVGLSGLMNILAQMVGEHDRKRNDSVPDRNVSAGRRAAEAFCAVRDERP